MPLAPQERALLARLQCRYDADPSRLSERELARLLQLRLRAHVEKDAA